MTTLHDTTTPTPAGAVTNCHSLTDLLQVRPDATTLALFDGIEERLAKINGVLGMICIFADCEKEPVLGNAAWTADSLAEEALHLVRLLSERTRHTHRQEGQA